MRNRARVNELLTYLKYAQVGTLSRNVVRGAASGASLLCYVFAKWLFIDVSVHDGWFVLFLRSREMVSNNIHDVSFVKVPINENETQYLLTKSFIISNIVQRVLHKTKNEWFRNNWSTQIIIEIESKKNKMTTTQILSCQLL